MTPGKQVVQGTVDAVLAPIGFKRRGSVWTRSRDSITQVVGLQKSQHGSQFYVNVGIGFDAAGTTSPIREKDLGIRLRADSIFNPIQREAWVRCLDLEQDMSDADRERELTALIEKSIVPQLETWQAVEGLRASLKDGDLSDALVSADARAALNSSSK
jgi:hypothetical protein